MNSRHDTANAEAWRLLRLVRAGLLSEAEVKRGVMQPPAAAPSTAASISAPPSKSKPSSLAARSRAPAGSASVAMDGGRGVPGIHLFLFGEPTRLVLPRRR
jgi:hypothetical protein